MLKELVFSLILSAYSSAPFLDSPKRAVENEIYQGHYVLELGYSDGDYHCLEVESPINVYWDKPVFEGLTEGQTFRPNNDGIYSLDSTDGFIDLHLSGPSDPFYITITDDAFSDGDKIQVVYGSLDWQQGDTPIYLLSTPWGETQSGYYTAQLEFYYREPPVEVTPNFTFNNCHLEGLGRVWVGDNLEVTLIANDGFGIPNTTQIITNGQGYSAVTMVTESEPLQEYPGLYKKVVFRFNNVAANLAATFNAADLVTWSIGYQWGYDDGASDPTDTAYQNGYSQGSKDGYKTGYEEGKKDYQAGGIWSWFESSAVVLASFLNIQIFPSFTIGALVGALVGLAIILFFIRAFLFRG